jgi:Lsr2
MARQTTITLVDDLDGTEAEEQVEFSVDGRRYEIDLSAVNAGRLRGALVPFISAARRTGARRAVTAGGRPTRAGSERAQNQAIREWATAQGMKVSERGRIPTSVLTAYHSAH